MKKAFLLILLSAATWCLLVFLDNTYNLRTVEIPVPWADKNEDEVSEVSKTDDEFDKFLDEVAESEGVELEDTPQESGEPYPVKPGHVAYDENTEGYVKEEELQELIPYLFKEAPETLGTHFRSAQRMDENEFLVKTEKTEFMVDFEEVSDGLSWKVYRYGSAGNANDTYLVSDNWED